MEDKKVEATEYILSIKRIEFLLEEIILQQVITRSNDTTEAGRNFTMALENVSHKMKEYVQSLPPATPMFGY